MLTLAIKSERETHILFAICSLRLKLSDFVLFFFFLFVFLQSVITCLLVPTASAGMTKPGNLTNKATYRQACCSMIVIRPTSTC